MKYAIAIAILSMLSILSGCSSSSSSQPAPPPFDLLLEADDQHIHIGNSTHIRAYSRDQESGIITDVTSAVTFINKSPEIAVNERYGPKITALAEGIATFNGRYHGKEVTSLIRITDGNITQLELSTDDDNLHSGSTSQIMALATYDDGSTDDVTDTVEWTTDEQWVAYFKYQDGIVYANNPGTANIYAAYGDITSPAQLISVHRGTMVDLSIISSHCCVINKGKTISFTALSHWDDGDTDNITLSTKWISSDSKILNPQADRPYALQAMNEGRATIFAAFGGFDTSETVTVERALASNLRVEMDAELLDLDRDGLHYWIDRGDSTQLTVYGDLSDGTKDADVTHLVEWQWRNEGTEGSIEIDENSVAHGLTLGRVIIFVLLDGTSSEYRGANLWIGINPED